MAVNNGPSCQAFVFENTPIATTEGVLEFEDGQGKMDDHAGRYEASGRLNSVILAWRSLLKFSPAPAATSSSLKYWQNQHILSLATILFPYATIPIEALHRRMDVKPVVHRKLYPI